MGVGLRLVEAELGASHNDTDLVLDPVRDELVDGEGSGNSVHNRQHVRTKVVLQLSLPVQIIENDLGNSITLQNNDESLTSSATRFVTNVRDSLEFVLLDKVGDLHRQVIGVHLVGQLGNDQTGTAVNFLGFNDGAHRDRTVPGSVGLVDSRGADNQSTGGKVWSLHPLENRVEQFVA
ncbi:unannotated protein [freshwater metagenome]|uniref:Unannotated protein n=1 Tax=freshwater metagenome TaxID=449393 RepID=A0A6J7E0C1_9ZZZZ